jgi:hypothetical protein
VTLFAETLRSGDGYQTDSVSEDVKTLLALAILLGCVVKQKYASGEQCVLLRQNVEVVVATGVVFVVNLLRK